MIAKMLLAAATTFALTAAGYGGLTVALPDVASTIETFARNRGLGWTDTACQANALGCLTNRYDQLAQMERAVDQSVTAIRAEFDRTSSIVSDQELLAGKNAAFLDQGRATYRDRLGYPSQPIVFAGRTYPNLDVFRAQLELLFQEKTALDQRLVATRELRGKLKERLDSLMIQSGQVTLAKRMVPGQIQLVKANKTLSDFGANVAMIDGVIRGSEAGLNQTEQLIRTTQDLMVASGKPTDPAQPRAGAAAFENYLRN